MKFSSITSIAVIGVLTSSVVASPIAVNDVKNQERQLATVSATVDQLLAQVQGITAEISKSYHGRISIQKLIMRKDQTIATVPVGATIQEVTSIVTTITPNMQSLQILLTQATTTIQGLTSLGCVGTCITAKASALVAEISYTVKGVTNSLGSSEFMNPNMILLAIKC
jgi:hypothetical protein